MAQPHLESNVAEPFAHSAFEIARSLSMLNTIKVQAASMANTSMRHAAFKEREAIDRFGNEWAMGRFANAISRFEKSIPSRYRGESLMEAPPDILIDIAYYCGAKGDYKVWIPVDVLATLATGLEPDIKIYASGISETEITWRKFEEKSPWQKHLKEKMIRRGIDENPEVRKTFDSQLRTAMVLCTIREIAEIDEQIWLKNKDAGTEGPLRFIKRREFLSGVLNNLRQKATVSVDIPKQ